MKSLSDTIARLAAFRAPKCTMGRSYGPRTCRDSAPIPERCEPGDTYRRAFPREPRSLWCLTDAPKQRQTMTMAPRLADRHGFTLLFPEQRCSNNANLCFNWFVPGDIRRDAGEALSIRRWLRSS